VVVCAQNFLRRNGAKPILQVTVLQLIARVEEWEDGTGGNRVSDDECDSPRPGQDVRISAQCTAVSYRCSQKSDLQDQASRGKNPGGSIKLHAQEAEESEPEVARVIDVRVPWRAPVARMI
jgi:hypothetical protein